MMNQFENLGSIPPVAIYLQRKNISNNVQQYIFCFCFGVSYQFSSQFRLFYDIKSSIDCLCIFFQSRRDDMTYKKKNEWWCIIIIDDGVNFLKYIIRWRHKMKAGQTVKS